MKKHGLLRLKLLLLSLMALAPVAHATISYSTNLVTNGSATSNVAMTGWDATSGPDFSQGSFGFTSPDGGDVFDFYTGSVSPEWITQTIDVSSLSADISAGTVKMVLSSYMIKGDIGPTSSIICRMILEQLNVSHAVVATSQVDNDVLSVAGSGGTWAQKTITVNGLNTSTSKLRIKLYGELIGTTGSAFVEFDGISLQLYKLATVQSVSVPANNTYKVGDALNFIVSFDSLVNVTGSPKLSLILNTGGAVQASYVSGSGSQNLVFRYTVASGNADADGVTVGALALNGGTIRSDNGDDAELNLYNVGATTGVKVDGVVPAVSSVAPPTSGTYASGQNLDFIATFTKAVNVASGTPYITLTVGGLTKHAVYASGTGTTALTFRYTLASGDAGALATGTGITLNSGTIQDAVGNSATLAFTAPTTSGITVDAVAPTISSVAPPAGGTYASGQNLDFTATFTKAVTVVTTGGTPYLTLTVGSNTVHASYFSGSGTSALVFRYPAASGDFDVDGVALGSNISLNGGAIKDAAGNDATSTFVGSLAAGVLVDARPSQTITFSALASQTYGTDYVKLAATASSSLAVSYASANSAAVRISNDTAYLLADDTATITASQAGNASYLAATPVSRILTIVKNGLTITRAAASNKAYDGTVSANVTGATLSGKVGADDVSLTLGTATFAAKDTGTAKAVTVTGSSLSGTKAGNYTLIEVAGLSANITQKSISVTADAQTKVYGSSDPTLSYVAPALYSGDAFTGELSRTTGETVGKYAISLGSLTAGGNYAVTFVGDSLSITKAPLTITGATASNKVYDGTVSASVTGAT